MVAPYVILMAGCRFARHHVVYLGGRAFEKPVVLGEDAEDARYKKFCGRRGQAGAQFERVESRHVFEGLNDGVTFCVIDYSDVKTRRMNGATQYSGFRTGRGRTRPRRPTGLAGARILSTLMRGKSWMRAWNGDPASR